MSSKIYSYNRISSNKQSIERQIRNAKELYPNAIIVEEVFTGTKVEGRKEFQNLVGEWTTEKDDEGKDKQVLKGGKVKQGDTIVFDSVSRMSRNAEEGFKIYKELYNQGIELVFIKEPHINTTTYKEAMTGGVAMTGTIVDSILEGINKYLLALAEQQIKLAFEQSEKEVMDLRQRTKEGMETARLNGKQIGQVEGTKLTTKKSIVAKEQIIKYSKDFKGTLKDTEVMKLVGLARNTYYKYKRELVEELN